jgi:cell division protein DivIC
VVIRFKYADKIPPVLRNKYFLTLAVFIIWLLFLDANNLIARYNQMSDLNKLNKDREYYMKKIEEDRKKLNQLKTDNHNLEKFAREQYRMKRKDEDLYIVVTPKEDRKIRRGNN